MSIGIALVSSEITPEKQCPSFLGKTVKCVEEELIKKGMTKVPWVSEIGKNKSGALEKELEAAVNNREYGEKILSILDSEFFNQLPNTVHESSSTTLGSYIEGLYDYEVLNSKLAKEIFMAYSLLRYEIFHILSFFDDKHALIPGPLLNTMQRKCHLAVECRNTLINHNLRLVIPFAKKYASTRHQFENFINIGNEGLFDAVNKFDALLDPAFSTYASYAIRRRIFRLLRKERTHNKRFKQKDFDASLGPSYEVEHDLDFGKISESLKGLLNTLTPRQREVIEWRYGFRDGKYRIYKEVGMLLGISKQAVEKTEKLALKTLREHKIKIPLDASDNNF